MTQESPLAIPAGSAARNDTRSFSPSRQPTRSERLATVRKTYRIGEPYRVFHAGEFIFTGSSIPEQVMACPALSPGEKLCFSALTRYQGVRGDAFPSYEELAKSLGVVRRQAQRYVEALEEVRLIRHSVRSRAGKGKESNSYEFLWHPLLEMSRDEILQLRERSELISLATCTHMTDLSTGLVTDLSTGVATNMTSPLWTRMSKEDSQHEDSQTTPTPHTREESDGAGDDSLIGKLQSPDTKQEFNRLNTLLSGPELNGQGRLRIAKAAAKYGFTLANLTHAFSKHSGGLNQAGGLLRFAEAWPVSTAGISDWPQCGKCLDEGFTADGACGCDAGVRWLKKRPSEAARLRAKREGKRFCEMCDNTGIDKFFDVECRACGNGRETPQVGSDGVPEL